MHPADGASGQSLIERLDDMQSRLEHLEYLVLPLEDEVDEPSSAAESLATTDSSVGLAGAESSADDYVEPTPRASIDHDLRVLQAETDDDQPFPLPAPGPAAPTLGLVDLSERFAGRAMALVGGAALVLGAVFFLSLAFSRGWIGPEMQVVMGAIGGAIGLAIGAFLLLHGDRVVGHVLTAVGLAVISLSLFAATSLYGLIEPAPALLATVLVAAVTTAIAVVSRSQVVAAFGLVAVLAAPPILGAQADQTTLAYMILVLAGVAVVSLWQTWAWLPIVAFAVSAPQVWAWVASGPGVELGVAGLMGYWALLALAAGGEAFRHRRPELTLTSAPLFMVVGAFTILTGLQLFEGGQPAAAFLLILAALHGVVAAWFLARRGETDPFGLLAGAYGIAIATMAIPLLAGGAFTVVMWSAEAAALAFLAGRRAHGPSLIGALVLFSVAAARVLMVVIDSYDAWLPVAEQVVGPIDVVLASWGTLLVAGLLIVALVPARAPRLMVIGIAALASVPVIYQQLDGTATVAAWCAIVLLAVSAPRWTARLPERAIAWHLGPALEWLRPESSQIGRAVMLTYTVAALAGGLAVMALMAALFGTSGPPDVAFSDAPGRAAVLIAATSVLAGILHGGARSRAVGIVGAAFVLGLVAPFEMAFAWAVVFWAGLAMVLFIVGWLDIDSASAYPVAAMAALGAAAVGALALAPPDRLVVAAAGVAPHLFLISEATLVLGAIVVALLVGARLYRGARWAEWAVAASGIAGLYLLSVATVDVFAAEVYGPPRATGLRVAELGKEAHVALSVMWTVVGVALTGAGLVFKRVALRVAGLAVLALATAKVFIIDLASLDIAYRVITLLVLGVLLIAIAWIWTRLRPQVIGPTTDDEGAVPASQDAHVNA